MRSIVLYISLFSILSGYAQSVEQRQIISSKTNVPALQNLAKEFSKQYHKNREAAFKMSKLKNWKHSYTIDNTYYELQGISKEGQPIYYKEYNTNASLSTRTNHINHGGSMNLNVDGQNMMAYVWDSGFARPSHIEYAGEGETQRYIVGEPTYYLSYHSAHVTGTIIASGINNTAKGMAPKASVKGYKWNEDVSEASLEASNGMLLSNHSYGHDENQVPDDEFGAYNITSYQWDQVMYFAPYYLMVVAAGNAGINNTCNGLPLEGNPFFDKLKDFETCKNNIVVANAIDADVSPDGELIDVTIYPASSQGPTDDYRIKPDITGNGTAVYSTIHTSDNAYGYDTGTSMASPNITGSLLLLQQYYQEVNGTYMKAATLKGLALHTADDGGMEGPDTNFGWGLMNTKKAAETILNHDAKSIIFEGTLQQGESYSIVVNSDNINPLLASISWTDIPLRNTISTSANDSTPVLIDDLDVRVSNGATTYQPWKLTSVNSNAKGDNSVDPFERVDIANPNGSYTITVTHKGSLYEGTKDFSLIVTGISSSFVFEHHSNQIIETCNSEDVTFDFDFYLQQDTIEEVVFSAQNLPEGASVSFSPETTMGDTLVSMTISDLIDVPPGNYIITVSASNTVEWKSIQVYLTILNTNMVPTTLLTPMDGSETLVFVTFNWLDDINAQSYIIEISENEDFSDVAISESVDSSRFSAFNLKEDTTYFWRVKPVNQCEEGMFFYKKSFTTSMCQVYSTMEEDLPISNSLSLYNSVEIDPLIPIESIVVFVDITHEDIGSLKINLINPNGDMLNLLQPSSCNIPNLKLVFGDYASTTVSCNWAMENGYIGIVKPTTPLSEFNGNYDSGLWGIHIVDGDEEIDGVLNTWRISVCDGNESNEEEQEPNQNNNNFYERFTISPNPSNGDIQLQLVSRYKGLLEINLTDIYGRLIEKKFYNKYIDLFEKNIQFNNLSSGVYYFSINSGDKKVAKKLIIK